MTACFMDRDFLLREEPARRLYHAYAAAMPVCDYHNHLPAEQIAEDTRFENLGRMWLGGDHYKWRAMRSSGVPERLCTGDASDREKFRAWAATVPHTLRNPLYHWTHLELQRYFDEHRLLSPATADAIFDRCSALLQEPGYSVRNLLRRMNVKLLCTTNDPLESLAPHRQLAAEGFEIKVLPTFRPDRAMMFEAPDRLNPYLDQLGDTTGMCIETCDDLLEALERRHAYFERFGCRMADHALDRVVYREAGAHEIASWFRTVRGGAAVAREQADALRTFVLLACLRMNHRRGWAQMLHIGALRNNCTRLYEALGPDIGCDSIHDEPVAFALSRLLDRLDRGGELGKTVLFNLNPRDNELLGSMIGNFQDGTVPGKMQFGPGWWFMDQKDGMERQMNALSALGLLSHFIGMVTDSRSFLSFPRHEYFRRILCNLIGEDVARGELPDDPELLGEMVGRICFANAMAYLGLPQTGAGEVSS